jgi:hypothetical protein
MSSAVLPEDAPAEVRARTIVHAEGWGSGTDTSPFLGDDDFTESFALCDPDWAGDGTTFLDLLRQGVERNETGLVLLLSEDGQQCRFTFDRVIDTRVSCMDERSYPARVDPRNRWNGWVSPYFTLDTVRQLAADTQADAVKYGHDAVDTIHVIEGGPTSEGETRAIVVHVSWQYHDESPEGGAKIVPPSPDGRYCIGGWEWTWYMIDEDEGDAA